MTLVRPRKAPWWLEAGPESCHACLRAYHVEAGYYCSRCDRPTCLACIVTLRQSTVAVCPDCLESESH